MNGVFEFFCGCGVLVRGWGVVFFLLFVFRGCGVGLFWGVLVCGILVRGVIIRGVIVI